MPRARFRDRYDAGQVLAEYLADREPHQSSLVLALPRGGVPVGYEVARRLNAPLDVFLVRKLGVPGHEELAMGAIATGGVRILNTEVVRALGITEDQIAAVATTEEQELERREIEYRGGRGAPRVEGKTVILVDDGLATGASMRAAAIAVRSLQPARLVIAVPVGASETCDALRGDADEVVCVETPDPFQAVGLWYEDFSQTTDEEVRRLMEEFTAEGR